MKEKGLLLIQTQWTAMKIAKGWKDRKQNIFICICVSVYIIVFSVLYTTSTHMYIHTFISSMYKTVTENTYFQEQKVNRGQRIETILYHEMSQQLFLNLQMLCAVFFTSADCF